MVYLILFLVAALSRYLPHPPNVTAIVAISVIAGAYVSPRWAWLVPLTAILVTDVFFLEPYGATAMAFVYGGHALAIGMSLLGSWAFVRQRAHRQEERETGAAGRIRMRSLLDGYVLCGAAAFAGLLFWTVSNFGSFLVYYPQTPNGLATCYGLALPFLRNQLLGDVLITGGLFLAIESLRPVAGPAWMGFGGPRRVVERVPRRDR
ncbi:MAG TPA: DUF6580 family putative transport protein [Pirellulaceae bacterium]|jgi:hypothetical protein|nr:DUF6580 family putative transport protein [Pirellulaceae bacterium]